MSSRIFNMELALEKQVCNLHGYFTVGAAGAVSSYGGIGVDSVVKESTAGQYTINLTDAYDAFLLHTGNFIMNGSGSEVATVEIITAPASLQASFKNKSYIIQCYNSSLVAANPANGSTYHFQITSRRSSVGPTWSV